jgi:hypothetical protein
VPDAGSDPERKEAMNTAVRDRSAAPSAGLSALPDTDSLLSELGVLYPVMTFPMDVGDAPSPADAREAPSGSSGDVAAQERRTEMDERIMTGLLWQ